MDWTPVAAAIRAATGHPFQLHRATPVSGGDIHQSYCLEDRDGARYFVKLNGAQQQAMFSAEAAGLATLAATHTLRVPQVIAQGCAAGHSFLVLEHLLLGGRGAERQLGAQLAALHRATAGHFGFPADNFIGATPQPNHWHEDWITFWREQRLGWQLRLAARNGCYDRLQTLGTRLMENLPAFFDGYAPRPSLLHGDLWSGNHGFLPDGTPVIFDPAAYYGDRECDLAMTELFGGYGVDFYAGYHAAWPLHAGYAKRRELYNLYHILNHANLFGGGYARQAEGMLHRLLAAI